MPLENLVSDLTKTDTINEVPVYRVFVLGARGSGKTVFLSALFGHMKVTHPVNRFAIEAVKPEDGRILDSYYNRLCNPKLPWPAGTGAVTDFEFRCVSLRGEDPPIPLFHIRYKDYPGAYLTEGSEELNIAAETQAAHSILVLIDGQKVLEKIEDDYPPDGDTLESDLNSIIPLLERSARKPIHFLITKWDVLSGLHAFSVVKNTLLQCEPLANFIETRQDSQIRLVPVSAVGNAFAEFKFNNRTMIKRGRTGIRPANVDLSIVLTLMDQIRAMTRVAIMDKRVPYWVVKFLRGGTILTRLGLMGLSMGEWQFAFLPRIIVGPVLAALSHAEQGLEKSQESLGKRLERTSDQKKAAQAIYEIQAYRMARFVHEFPESGLTEATDAWIPHIGPSSSPRTSGWTTA